MFQNFFFKIPWKIHVNGICFKIKIHFQLQACHFTKSELLHWCFSRILKKCLPNYFHKYLFFRRDFSESLFSGCSKLVGPGFALDLIYTVTIPMNCICTLTFVTFHLHKCVIVTRQIKTVILIFQLITYAITYMKTEENNSEKTLLFFFSHGF